MDCPSCAGKVDKSLQRVDGVLETTLRPTTGTAAVTYDPERTTEGDVIAAIESAGYEVLGGSESEGNGSSGAVDIASPAEVWTSPRAIRTWIGAVFVALGLVFEFVLVGQDVPVASVLDYPLSVAAVLFLGAVAASGTPVVRSGYYSARNRSLDIDLLMGTAILAATGIGYFVEAATLAVLFSIAELMEGYAMDRARDSLRGLMALSPNEATVRREGAEVTVSTNEVEVGETVIVCPARRSPSTARSSRARARWTSLRSPGRASPSTRSRTTRCTPARSTRTATWRSRRRRWPRTPRSRGSSRWYRGRRRRRRTGSSSSTGSRATTRRSWSCWRS